MLTEQQKEIKILKKRVKTSDSMFTTWFAETPTLSYEGFTRIYDSAKESKQY